MAISITNPNQVADKINLQIKNDESLLNNVGHGTFTSLFLLLIYFAEIDTNLCTQPSDSHCQILASLFTLIQYDI